MHFVALAPRGPPPDSIDVIKSSSHYELIIGIECMLWNALTFCLAVGPEIVLKKSISLSFFLLSFFPSGCPPCMWRRNRHGDGALHPGASRLCHQPVLLRLHPKRNQVHLPQKVCSCSPLLRLGALCSLECCFWPCCFLVRPLLPLLFLSHSLLWFLFFFFPSIFSFEALALHHFHIHARRHQQLFVHTLSIISTDSTRQLCDIAFIASPPPLFNLLSAT